MTFKLIEVATPDERVRAITSIAEEMNATDVQVGAPLGDGRRLIRLLVGEIDRQALLDRLQAALGKSENWHIMMLSTDTVIPREPEEEEEAEPEEEDEEKKKEERARASREELYNLVAGGVRLDTNFILLVALSAVVASVGLERDSVAVVIGAMVIAPLLGPNVAFAFATAIGDRALMLTAARAISPALPWPWRCRPHLRCWLRRTSRAPSFWRARRSIMQPSSWRLPPARRRHYR